MRFGLVGTGHWARVTHAPAIAATTFPTAGSRLPPLEGTAGLLVSEHFRVDRVVSGHTSVTSNGGRATPPTGGEYIFPTCAIPPSPRSLTRDWEVKWAARRPPII
jgi:hypothetical protein